MKKDDSVYLNHILDSIERFEEYIGGMEKTIFHLTIGSGWNVQAN